MFLLLYIREGQQFDVEALHSALAANEETTVLSDHKVGCLSYEYRTARSAAIIRPEGESVMIDGMNEASLAAALTVQRILCRDIRVVDDANTFDLNLSGFHSAEELYETMARAGIGHALEFQRNVAGPLERQISGGGEVLWADGIDYENVIEARFLTSMERSPFLSGSCISDFVREQITRKTSAEFARLAVILRDIANPLTRARVIVSDARLRPFFKAQLKSNRIKGNVLLVRP